MQERGFEAICHMGLLGIRTQTHLRLASHVAEPRALTCDWQIFFYSRPLKMGRAGCPETSVKKHHYSLPNNPDGRSFLLRGGSLKSHKAISFYIQYSEPPTDTKRDVTFSDKLHIDNDSPSYEMNRKSACTQGHSDVTTRTNRWCRWRWRDIITASLEAPPDG